MFTSISAFAEYVLTPDDQKIVDTIVQKIQAKPINARDRIIDGLQKAQTRAIDEKNLAILKSVESRVRLKTPQGDVIATKNERKELLKLIFKSSNNNGLDKAVMAKVNASGSFTTSDNERISFSGTIDEAVDMNDISNPKISFKIDFSGSNNDQSMTGAGEVRLLDKIAYFQLSKLTSNEPNISAQIDQIKKYMGIWWKTPYQANGGEITQLSSDLSQEEKQKIIELISQNNFIPKLLIAKTSHGTTYSGVVDNREIVKLINTFSAEKSSTISASEKRDLIDGLSHITFFVSMGLDNNSQFRT